VHYAPAAATRNAWRARFACAPSQAAAARTTPGVERRQSLVDDDRVQVGARGPGYGSRLAVDFDASEHPRIAQRFEHRPVELPFEAHVPHCAVVEHDAQAPLASDFDVHDVVDLFHWCGSICSSRSRRERAPSFAATGPGATAPDRGHALGAAGQRSAQELERLDCEHRDLPAVARMEVGDPMLLEEHLDRDAVEATDGRHGVIVAAAGDGLGAGLIRSSGAQAAHYRPKPPPRRRRPRGCPDADTSRTGPGRRRGCW
jgi:hypothetical protein